MDNLRILLVHNYYKIPGGEDSVFDNECRLLKSMGNEVIEYTRHNRDLKIHDLLFTAPFSKRTYRDVREILRDRKPDIVHVHNDRYLISPSVFQASFDEGIPVVQTIHNFRLLCINAMLTRNGRPCSECRDHGSYDPAPAVRYACFRNNPFLTRLVLRVNKRAYLSGIPEKAFFIALTDFNKDIYTRTGFKSDRVFVKPNFTYASARSGEKMENKKDFIFLGRLDPLKGIEDILNEWKQVPENAVLNIAGEGEKEYTEYLKKRFPLKNVRFLGGLDHDTAMEKLGSAKAMIFGSIWYEGFPMTIIESFMNRTPVIGKNFGNGGDIIKKIYGSEKPLLRDISELHKRIVSFDEDRASGLYDYDPDALNDYTPDRNYELLIKIYRECIGKGQSPDR